MNDADSPWPFTGSAPDLGYAEVAVNATVTPSVTTLEATLVEETTVTLNGTITDEGDSSPTERGFEYDINSGSPYTYSTNETDTYSTGPYGLNLTSLTKGELYYYRAYATNGEGTGYGAEVDFLTKPDEPTNFTNAGVTAVTANLTWDAASGADNYMVRSSTSTYPTTTSSGTQRYLSPGLTTNVTGLAPSTAYYFSVWSQTTEGGLTSYSDTYDTINATTAAPPPNSPPVLDAIGGQTANENSELTFTINATDLDVDALTYSASNLPSGATFTPGTRTFAWTPTYAQATRAINPTLYQNIHFEVTDGTAIDSENITINVYNTNRAPILGSIGNKTVNPGTQLSISFGAGTSDPDSDDISYILDSYLPGALIAQDGQFAWTPEVGQEGAYTITVSITDTDLSDAETFTIRVGSYSITPSDVYVDIDMASSDDGLRPSTAYKTIAEGVAAAYEGEIVGVGAGTYAESPWNGYTVLSGRILRTESGSDSLDSRDSGGRLQITKAGTGTPNVGHAFLDSSPVASSITGDDTYYFDTYLSSATNVTSYQITVTPAEGFFTGTSDAVLYWYNGSSWIEVSSYSYNESSVTVTATITASTSPTLSQLTGTPFGVAADNATAFAGLLVVAAFIWVALCILAIWGLLQSGLPLVLVLIFGAVFAQIGAIGVRIIIESIYQ
jgi:hypothetical protein